MNTTLRRILAEPSAIAGLQAWRPKRKHRKHGGPPPNEHRRAQVRALHAEGKTDVEIARELGLTRERIRQLRNKMDLPKNIRGRLSRCYKCGEGRREPGVRGRQYVCDTCRVLPYRQRGTPRKTVTLVCASGSKS